MKKRFFIALIFLFFLSTYSLNRNSDLNIKLNIEEIFIENNNILSEQDVKNDLSFLYKKNLILINAKEIEEELNNQKSFIDSLEIKKIYPNKIKIKIFEKKPIFILQNKKKNIIILIKIHLLVLLKLVNLMTYQLFSVTKKDLNYYTKN